MFSGRRSIADPEFDEDAVRKQPVP